MATLAEVVKRQRQGGQGALGALTSAIGQKTLEAIDPRRMLNQKGLLTALFPSLKPYQAKGAAERISKSSADLSSATTPMLQEMNVKLDIVGDNTRLTAKNTMMLPSMARDMNVMRQNVIKLVKLQGGKASTRADNFFLRAFERERATESELQAAKARRLTSTTPTPEKKDSGGLGILGMLGGILSIGSVIGGLSKAVTSIPNLILKGLTTLPDLIISTLTKLPKILLEGLSPVVKILKSVGSGLVAAITKAVGLIMSVPGLAALGIGGVATLLGWLMTNEKTQYGTEVEGATPEDSTYTPISENAKGLSEVLDERAKGNVPKMNTTDDSLGAYLYDLNKRNQTDPGYIPQNATPSPAMQTSPTPATPTGSTSPKQIPSVSSTELGGINYSSYAQTIGQRESGGDYKAVNSLGYLGKYQFGAMALEDMGLVKKGVGRKGQKALEDPSNWTIEGGKEAFLNNPSLQEQTMVRYTKQNFRSLKNLGVINDSSSADKIAGYLSSAHLVGPGGAAAMFRGEDRSDAYGTKASSYFQLGSASQLSTPPSTQGSQIATVSSEIADMKSVQAQPNVVVNAPTMNNNVRNGGQQQMPPADVYNRDFLDLVLYKT